MTQPNLDKRRSALLNQIRLFNDAGQDQMKAGEIALGALASLGLRSVSPGKFDAASKLFEDLAGRVRCFDAREEILGPWRSDVETGVVSPDWTEEMCLLAECINDRLSHLIGYGERHGVLEVVPSQPFHFDALFSLSDRLFFESLDAEFGKATS